MPFTKDDPNINRKGRPLKGDTLTDLMKEFLEEVPEGQKISRKKAFVKRVYELALQNNDTALIKLIWNYIDGLPKATIEVRPPEDILREFMARILEDEQVPKISEGSVQRPSGETLPDDTGSE